MTLSVEELRARLKYDPKSGVFRWSARHAICLAAGDIAGRVGNNGYRQIKIKYVAYLAHRLAWLYVHGEWPMGQIDHINGNRTDNRICNLRDVSASINQLNRHVPMKNETTGFAGVYVRRNGRFGARIRLHGRLHYLGVYDTPEEAHAAWARRRDEEMQATRIAA